MIGLRAGRSQGCAGSVVEAVEQPQDDERGRPTTAAVSAEAKRLSAPERSDFPVGRDSVGVLAITGYEHDEHVDEVPVGSRSPRPAHSDRPHGACRRRAVLAQARSSEKALHFLQRLPGADRPDRRANPYRVVRGGDASGRVRCAVAAQQSARHGDRDREPSQSAPQPGIELDAMPRHPVPPPIRPAGGSPRTFEHPAPNGQPIFVHHGTPFTNARWLPARRGRRLPVWLARSRSTARRTPMPA